MPQSWKLMLTAALIALAASEAEADFSPNFTGLTSTATTTTFNYTLAFTTANFGGTNQLVSGNFATLYDLVASPSGIASTSTPANILATSSLVGLTASPFVNQTVDNPNLYNLTFSYTGPTLTVDTNFSVSVTLNGQFTTEFRNYTSTTQYTATGGGTGTSSTLGFATQPRAVPEPSALALCGIAGAFGLTASLVRRRRAAPASDAAP